MVPNLTSTNSHRLVALALAVTTIFIVSACSGSAPAPTQAPSGLTIDPTATTEAVQVDPTATRVPAPPSPTPEPTSTPTPVPTPTEVPPTATATATSVPTATPSATSTPAPTATPVPTVELGQLPTGVISAFTVSETLDRQSTPTATPFPTAVQPFIEPTPTPTSGSDLQPYFGNGQPVRVRNPNGGPFVEKSDLLVDFFFTNAGSTTITDDYYIDLYIDGAIAQRWLGIKLEPSTFAFIEGGTGLLDAFELEPGDHEVKLVVDPTNLIAEASDGDNTHTATFTWAGPAIPTPEPGTRLPNLTFARSTTGITAAPFLGASNSGGLSTNGTTALSISVLNDSPISITREFMLTVLFDDVLVYKANYTGLIGGQNINLDWEGITDAVRITPGEHTVKVIADASGAVTESDESDNSLESVFVWGTGDPIAAPAPEGSNGAPIRTVQVLPNFTGVTPYGWDAAISASNSSEELALGADGKVWAEADTKISLAMRNSSRVNSAKSGAFEAQIFIDNELLETIRLGAGDDAGSYWTESITIPANSLEPGEHLVTMIVDSNDEILESNESDNSLGRWFEFLPGAPTDEDASAFVLSDAELTAMLAPLTNQAFIDQVLPVSGSGIESPEWSGDIEQAAKAGYYLLTGRDLDAERIVMHLLPHDQFVAASFNACMTDYFLLSDPTYIATYDACTNFRGEIGFKFRLNGKVHVYVDLDESPILALGVYFHELGHALQDLENPDQTDAPHTQNLRGLFEAQAQIFEAAALRSIEEYLGIGLIRYPNNSIVQGEVQFVLDNSKALEGSAEHVLGHNFLWYEVLTNTSGLGFDAELRANKKLSATSAKALFDYLVSLDPSALNAWVSQISVTTSAPDEFAAISMSRLEDDLPAALHGNPGLREPAFLIP